MNEQARRVLDNTVIAAIVLRQAQSVTDVPERALAGLSTTMPVYRYTAESSKLSRLVGTQLAIGGCCVSFHPTVSHLIPDTNDMILP